ncbi:nuclear transport factor 2 family protein [Parahaliea sp. F7430]|uniref:Nuclear transport factor 2 family protein n=1 Tax=Sediminihaliea albiluteola TaxID=2758564 RepID=A0A7W2TXC6_9GAMM|nr:nuclear transport factor 2 family protein [Sediminihaliea albiluteola]MBA6413679.1 nuclear transport factor 2 family protein [Sediminihaliea albiluteola]
MSKRASDEREILNTLNEFPRVVDRNQWDRVGEVFAEDVRFNYGDGQEQQGLDALLQQFRSFHDRCSAMQHLIGSVQLELDGNRAVTRAYVQARHQGKGAYEQSFYDTHGEYSDQWARRPEGWRIVRRDAHWVLSMGEPKVLFDSE